MTTIGEKIKYIRQSNNLTQIELANILNVSEKTISSWENNRTYPDINMIYKLSDEFKKSFIYLINENYTQEKNEVSVKIKLSKEKYEHLHNRIQEKTSKKAFFNQTDLYYAHQKWSLTESWLRIRNENGKYILSYKKRKNSSYFEKYDVQFDNITNLEIILKSLGFEISATIEKERTIYQINDFSISFDNVKNIGLFVEIKYIGQNDDYETTYLKIIDFLNSLHIDLNDIDSKKYIDYL